MPVKSISVDIIEAGQRLREISEAQVNGLMSSIADIGLLNPISVYERKIIRGGNSIDGYGLIAGAHRLEAFSRLGLADIEANVLHIGELERQIAECDENLCASTLTPSERARFTKRRKQAYEALHPETKHGAIGVGREKSRQLGDSIEADRFTAETATATGKSERAVQRDAERGQKVIGEVIDMITGTKLDTGTYLDKLKRLNPNEQVIAAKRDLSILKSADKDKASKAKTSKIDADVKSRAAREVASMILEHVPGEWWDAVKANLYAAGAANIANELTNMAGEAIMDRRRA